MNQEPTPRELMAAIVDLRGAVAQGFTAVDRRFEDLEFRMNKRFDSVDLRFDSLERRLTALESRAS